MCNSVCGNFIRLPWIMQLVVPFMFLVAIGLALGPNVEAAICSFCN